MSEAPIERNRVIEIPDSRIASTISMYYDEGYRPTNTSNIIDDYIHEQYLIKEPPPQSFWSCVKEKIFNIKENHIVDKITLRIYSKRSKRYE